MTALIVLVIGAVVLVPLFAIGWTLRHEPLRFLPRRDRRRRPF
jgi:hypothetical protein